MPAQRHLVVDVVEPVLQPWTEILGQIRSRRDLLEAVVLPSANVVNGYENYIVRTHDGGIFSGLIQRESADAVYLKSADQQVRRVSRGAMAFQLASSRTPTL